MTKKITVQEEGVTVSEGVRVLNFLGAGATASSDGSVADILIPGGGGGAEPPTDIYVAPSVGSDANDGLTPGTALLTITKAIELVGSAAPANFAPIIHLESGTYSATQLSGAKWPSLTRENSGIIFWGDGAGQGGDDGKNVTLTGGIDGMDTVPPTSTNNHVYTIDAITPGNYVGQTLEILDGACAGQRRTIVANDASSFTLAQGFSTNQGSGTWHVFLPAVVLDNDTAANGNVRQRYQMMPPAYSYGQSMFFDNSEGAEPEPNSPACVWANVLLTNSSGNTSWFMLTGGQVALFGVVVGTNATVQMDVVSLIAGTTKAMWPQSGTVTFEPAPTFAPIGNAVSNLPKKWNGWGYSVMGDANVGIISARKIVAGAMYMDDTLEVQNVQMGELRGVFPYNSRLYRCNGLGVVQSSLQSSIQILEGSRVTLGSDVYTTNIIVRDRSSVSCFAIVSDATTGAVTLSDGSHIAFDAAGFQAGAGITFQSEAVIVVGGDVPGNPALNMGSTPTIDFFTDNLMGCYGADGSSAKRL